MGMFKAGDRVRRADGARFSNDELVVTVLRIEGEQVWFTETNTWLFAEDLELVEDAATSRQIGGDHYQMPIQPIEFIVKNNLGYREGNVIKYVCRHGKKNGAEDIKKAIHYLEMILEDYEKEGK